MTSALWRESFLSQRTSDAKNVSTLSSHHDIVAQYSFTNATWWRHQMEAFSALLALCERNSPVTGEFPSQRPVTRSFDVFFDKRLNKQVSKQSSHQWFKTPLHSLWCDYYDVKLTLTSVTMEDSYWESSYFQPYWQGITSGVLFVARSSRASSRVNPV